VSVQDRLAAARQLLQRCESDRRRGGRLPTGLPGLDAALGGGVPAGALTEIVSAGEGLGAVSMALRIAASAAGGERPIFLIDPVGEFYPPAVIRMGVSLDRLIIVRPRGAKEAAWAMEQALRCRSVGAVVGWFGLSDASAVRRLQLAAESGRHVGLLVHDESHGAAARFAMLRLRVEGGRQKGQDMRMSKQTTKRDKGTKGHRDEGVEPAASQRLRLSFLKNKIRSPRSGADPSLRRFVAPSLRHYDSTLFSFQAPSHSHSELILLRTDLHGGRWPSDTLCVQLLKTGSTYFGEHDATDDVHLHAVSGGGPGESQHAAG